MRRKIWVMALGFALVCSVTACGKEPVVDVVTNKGYSVVSQGNKVVGNGGENAESNQSVAEINPAGMKTISKEDIKVGVVYIGSASDTSGYTYAHELGIQGMATNLGLKADQIVRMENVNDSDSVAITKALDDCINAGCNVIFTTSWGYMDLTEEYAKKYPDIYFAHGTGYKSNDKNFTNYFGRIYQARYLSGLVAGLKTKSNMIGYVSAMGADNSECTGGIDAFAMGVEKVNPNATVYVAVTNSWFSPDDELAASVALANMGCDVLAQHVDTTAPQTVSEERGTWSIGYNSDMSKETPNATLTSVIWNWSAYYTSYVKSIMNATYDGQNYYGGMDESLIGLTGLSAICEDGTQKIVTDEMQRILSGQYNVFEGPMQTNTGEMIGATGKTLDDATITGGINWYYKNVQTINWE